MDITVLLDCLALVTRVFLVERGATDRVTREGATDLIVFRVVALVAREARLLRLTVVLRAVGATLIMRLAATLRAQVCLLVPGVQPLVNRTDFAIVGRAVGRMVARD